MRPPIVQIRLSGIFPGRVYLAILLLVSMAAACVKEEYSKPDTTNTPGPLPDTTATPVTTPGAGTLTMVDIALDEWKFYPYSGPENGDDSLFLTKANLGGVDVNRLGRISTVYLSDPSGSRFAIKLSGTLTSPTVYSYSIGEVGVYGSPFLHIACVQLSPGIRPLADSAHVEFIR